MLLVCYERDPTLHPLAISAGGVRWPGGATPARAGSGLVNLRL